MTEDLIHKAVLQAAKAQLPGWTVAHIPNQNRAAVQWRVKLKALGVAAGMPDLMLIAPGSLAHFLEVKRPGGRLSRVQRDKIAELRALGCPVEVVSDAERAADVCRAWKKALEATR